MQAKWMTNYWFTTAVAATVIAQILAVSFFGAGFEASLIFRSQ